MRELLSKCLISGQINSFLYACVSVPPSSLQHSRAKLLFLLLKLFCGSGPLLLLMLLPLLWLEGFRGLHGEFRLRRLTSRLTENAREKKKKRGGGGTEEMQSFSEWRRRREAVGERQTQRIQRASEHCLIFDTPSPSCTVWLNSFLLVYSLSVFLLDRWEDE